MNQDISVVGIDIAKRVLHVIGMDTRGKIILRQRFYRGEVMPFMAQLPRVTVGMEACGGAHYWARQLRQQGHQVRLMAPQYVGVIALFPRLVPSGRRHQHRKESLTSSWHEWGWQEGAPLVK